MVSGALTPLFNGPSGRGWFGSGSELRVSVMFDVKDDANGGFRRVEILTGPARRRRWSADQKARIVAETLEPGARVAEVARRWQVCSQQVFGWRRAARRDVTTAIMTG